MVSREDAISHLQTIWAWAAIEDIRPREWEKVRHWVTDAIELLKQAPVRCGECRHRLGCLISDGPDGKKDWYCADGEREEQERIEL